MESLIVFLQAPSPRGLHSISPHFTIEPVLPSVAYPLIISSLTLEPSKKLNSKFITSPHGK